jgi:HNH endonuclease
MARKADIPCAGGCGKLLWSSRTSRPAGQRMCWPCRRHRSESRPPHVPVDAAAQPCVTCGKLFFPGYRPKGRPPQRFCSRSCGAESQRGNGGRQLRTCGVCGKQFTPSRGGRGQNQPTCSRACGGKYMAANLDKRRERWPSKPIWVRNCVQCGVLFVARRARQQACSKDCARKWSWAKDNLARRKGATEHVCPCGAVISLRRHKCDACLKRTRSEARRRKRRKERARERESIASELYTLAEIAERDHYLCGICLAEGKTRQQARVPMTKAVPHPRAPTIDHVIPWSISKDDTRANVQLAHFICNSRKHVNACGQQLALFG